MDDEVSQLRARVLELERELRCCQEELDEVAFLTAHDLQEPLRAVIGFSQLLAKQAAGKLGQDADESIDYILTAANRMSKRLAALIHFSEAGEAGNGFTVINSLDEPLNDAMRRLGPELRDTGCILTRVPLPVVRADHAQMAQVFEHLLSNALKFRRLSPPRVDIRVEDHGTEWQISVLDDGLGFHPQYAEHIFGIFRRIHGTRYPGEGMGLAICKRIVARHGGKIRAQGEEGVGARFHFTLPKLAS